MNETPDSTSSETPGMDRRSFIRQAAGLAAAAQLGLASALPARARQAAGAAASASGPLPKAPADNCVGIQMGPHTLLDEGIEHALDLIQETAAINTLFVYSHAYGGDLRKSTQGAGEGPRQRAARPAEPQAAARLGPAARPVLQGHDAAASGGGRELRVS